MKSQWYELSTVIDTTNCFLSLDAIDFGSDFLIELRIVEMDAEEIRILKENCFAYLKQLLKQMFKRLPENMNIFKIYG